MKLRTCGPGWSERAGTGTSLAWEVSAVNQRIDMHRLQDLVRLHRLNKGAREVARLLRMSPNTERQYREVLKRRGLLQGDPEQLPALSELRAAVEAERPPKPPHQTTSLTKWRELIANKVEAGATPTAIYDWLRLERSEEFTGSLSAVKRLCLRLKREQGIDPSDVAIPVETEPGEVAQVDFGYVGKLFDPTEQRLRKAWVFVMVLGYSRHMVCRIVFDQTVETWIRCHVEAFAELGGVPRVLVPDNLKAAVVRAAFGTEAPTTLNRSYRELARYYGCVVDPTPVRSPEKKGKVEAGVKYVKRNFFAARQDILDADVLQRELHRWVREIAGQRVHGTTRQRPLEVFEQLERDTLNPLPERLYEPILWREPKVHADTHVLFEKSLYSVPWRLVGERVLARGCGSSVTLYFNDERVALHERVAPGKRSTCEEHLPVGRRDLRHRSRDYWQNRAIQLGQDVGDYIREVFDSDDVLYQLRTVQQIVTCLEGYPPKRAQAACRRARYFANYTYGGIKRILTRALDQHPLPDEAQPNRGVLEQPRFVRDISELVQLRLEMNDAPN